MHDLAPIALFVYNRPWHTEQTLEALMTNVLADQSVLHIYADGPKPNATIEQREKINEVRALIRKKQWCKEVLFIESENNKGLADSIIDGVTEVVNKYGKIIVLEDDIVTTKGFLQYMNKALSLYKNEDIVMQVSAYIYPSKSKIQQDTLFLKIMACWGWGTWSRAWKYYNHNIEDHLNHFKTKEQIKKFNIEGHANYYQQLINNYNKRGYTWAVRWYASWLYKGGIALFPKISLIRNIGFDDSGQNIHVGGSFYITPISDNIKPLLLEIIEDKKTRTSIDYFYKRIHKKKTYQKVKFITKFQVIKKIKLIVIFLNNLIKENSVLQEPINIKRNCIIGKSVKISNRHRINNSSIGDYSYISYNSSIQNTQIEKFCSIGNNFICGHGIHPINGISTAPMFYSNLKQNGTTLTGKNKIEEFLPVTIGNDVFIGDNVVILSGVNIGDGAIIGAGAVVSKNIPPYAVAVGCPIQIKKFRFSEKQIDALLRIQWWNFSVNELEFVEKYFFDIDRFIERYDQYNLEN